MRAEALFTEDLSNQQGAGDSLAMAALDDPASSLAGLAATLPDEVVGGLARRPRNTGQPKCLLAEALRSGEGVGPVATLDEYSGKLLVITLEITEVVERTGLTVSVWGSDSQTEWGTEALLRFRQRQYCGVYSVLLNMAARPEIRYLRVGWDTSRWGKSERIPAFGFKVFVEESGARVRSSAVV
jgi:hypothetical protein